MPKADRLSPGAVALLKEKHLAHVATVMADGTPQNTPMWVDVEDDGSYILLNTADGRLKTRNVDRTPAVAVTVVDGGDAWRFVVARGVVEEKTTSGADAHIDKLAKKYIGVDTYPFRRPEETRVILRVRPTHVMESNV